MSLIDAIHQYHELRDERSVTQRIVTARLAESRGEGRGGASLDYIVMAGQIREVVASVKDLKAGISLYGLDENTEDAYRIWIEQMCAALVLHLPLDAVNENDKNFREGDQV